MAGLEFIIIGGIILVAFVVGTMGRSVKRTRYTGENDAPYWEDRRGY